MTSAPSPRVVVHVTDRTTGGVPVAVGSYVRTSSPAYAHVIVSPFVEGRPAGAFADLDALHVEWDGSTPARALRSLRGILRGGRFDVVHAHSSFPGAYVRLLRHAPRTRVVYTPHGFAFARADVDPSRRAVFRTIERVLAGRMTVLAACGPGEEREALSLGIARERALVVPNLASVAAAAGAGARPGGLRESGVLRVAMLGRWSPQKDPTFFHERVDRLRTALFGCAVRATWIGDGPSGSGIRVTGWLGSEGVRRELDGTDLYLHTAAWEGFPIAILDAAALGLPILARRISALPDLPPALDLDAGIDGVVHAVRAGRFAAWSAENRRGWREYLGPRDARSQARALARAWG
ncbi:glycosyltransferase [Microbacterium sp. NPDC090007]|uniref:glycosyltransferase n=1 Tax=Microbacterium sp. NPDC090007 TaxID=3364204 RepID=UPI0038307306